MDTLPGTGESKRRYTLADYLRLPEGEPYQLIEGELFMTPAPTSRHQRAVVKLLRLLADWADRLDAGEALVSPFDVVLDDATAVQPDVLFVCKERLKIIEDRCMGPPDLAVEVLSPSNAGLDRTRKLKLYARFGVPRVWVIDCEERTFECLGLDRGAYRIEAAWTGDEVATPPGFEGLSVPLPSLWPASQR
ncbi:MAG: Uma2 family endonuclease [Deltaproteobacteria bacterium]|nr:Uma2 family endonuclease [Deltaproteobacteria bacterium]